jgi:ABC-2 type transport system permease protein
LSNRAFHKTYLIAVREFRHTVLTKSFLIGVVGIPALMAACFSIVPMLLVSQLEPLSGTVAIVESTGRVADALDALLQEKRDDGPNINLPDSLGPLAPDAEKMLEAVVMLPDLVVQRATTSDDLDQLKDQARAGELVAVALIPASLLDTGNSSDRPDVELTVPNATAPRHISQLENLIRDAVVRARVLGAGKDLQAMRSLMRRPQIDMKRLGAAGGETDENVKLRSILPIVFMMLIWIATFTSGNYLLTSTIEEKSNKVIEVILSAVSPLQLLWGKVLGLAAVAGIILAMYGGLLIAAMVAFALTDLLSWTLLLWSGFFLLVAYFTIASIMAAVGSAVSDLREAQSLIGPVMMILMVPFVLWIPIGEEPNGVVAVVSSFIPPIQPFAMVMRLAAATEPIPTWQLIASAAVGVGSVFVFVWAASKIFRVGLLMQGKPPTPLELLRWIRRT